MKHLLLACLLTLFSFSLFAAEQGSTEAVKEVEIGKDLNRQAIFFYGFDTLKGFEEYHCIVDLGGFNLELEAVPHTKGGVQVGYKCIDYSYYLFPDESYMVDIAFKPWPSDRSLAVTSFYIKAD